MRACGACFYYRGDHEAGECFNRPPYSHVVNTAHDEKNGIAQFEVFAVRPPVRADEFCAFFSHKNGSASEKTSARPQVHSGQDRGTYGQRTQG